MENKNIARLNKMVLLPTPIAGDWKGAGRKDLSGTTLSARIAQLSALMAGNQVSGTNQKDGKLSQTTKGA